MAASTSTQQRLTEDYSCGYCLQRLHYMTDPRELPCSHVFCLPCLQADFENIDGCTIECTLCSFTHEIEDLTFLEKASVIDTSSRAAANEMETPCDMCKGVDCPSFCYCVDCDKKLCDQHFKLHEDFGLNHSTVGIAIYKSQPTRYQKEMCSEHKPEIVVAACRKCLNTLCLRCHTEATCISSDGKEASPHIIQGLELFATEMRQEVRNSMKTLSDKITEICKYEKEAWSKLDDIEVKVKEMIEEVERTTIEQIAEIKHKSAAMVERIRFYFTQSTDSVETYTAGLLSEKENLEDLWRSANEMVTQSHNVEVIGRTKETVERLEEGILKDPSPFIHNPGSLQAVGQHRDLEVTFGYQSFILKEFKPHKELSGSYSRSAVWTKDGNLLTTGRKFITLYDANLSPLHEYNKVGNDRVKHIAVTDTGFAIISGEIMRSEVSLYSKSMQRINTFGIGMSFLSSIAYNPLLSQIIILDMLSKQLKLYTYQGEFLFTTKLEGFQSCGHVHVLTDGEILVSDDSEGIVNRYRLQNQTLHLVWTCSGLTQPSAISSDSTGHTIYVASHRESIHVLSSDGKLMNTLNPPELVDTNILDISILDTKMAVACGKQALKIFNILWQ